MQFGKSIKHHWLLEEDVIFLNHGSFGATPKVVLESQQQWRDHVELQPVRFMTQELTPEIRKAATVLANFVGAQGEDLVFVENATAGVNAVLRSLRFQPSDQILTTNHCYGAVRQALKFVCATTGATLIEANVPFPLNHSDEVVQAVAEQLNSQVKLLVIDHITSPSALVFPLAKIIDLAHSHHIPVLVDGAHAPGMLALNLQELNVDWYAGNCHKWLFSPKGCGFLYTKPELQPITHPTVISHGYGSGYLTEFDWTGTRDFSTWLAITEAIAFQQQLGVDKIRAYNHKLANWAIQMLAIAWQQPLPAPLSMLGSMAAIQLPKQIESNDTNALHDWLWQNYRIEVPIIAFANSVWIRISAQVYNEHDDYVALAKALQP